MAIWGIFPRFSYINHYVWKISSSLSLSMGMHHVHIQKFG